MDNFDVYEWNKNRYLNRIEENKSYLEKLSADLSKQYPNLDFEVKFPDSDSRRIETYGSQRDLSDFGDKIHGKKFGEYEAFHMDYDDRKDTVRIVKSSITEENSLPLKLQWQKDFPSQQEVDDNFSLWQRETHYLADKPVGEWDEYDLSNYNSISRKGGKYDFNPIKETVKFIMDDLEGYSNYFPGGKTKGLSSDEMSTILMQIVKDIEKEGEQLDEGSMCKRGQNYMAARKRAGEKSSAYLSGRAVKVCKGQIKGSDDKKKKSFESLNEVNNSDIVKALAKVVDMEPKDVIAKIKADKEEVNEIAITTAITIAGLLPAAMELVGGAFNKAKNSFKLNDKEKSEYITLQQFYYKEANSDEEKKRFKKEMEPYESKIGNWFKDAGHTLHKAYTAPIRGLLWMASKLAPKDSSLKDKEKREKISNIIYAAAMIGIAGYGVVSHIGHLKGVSDVAITIADTIKGGKSIKDAALGALELLGLV